MAMPVEFIRGRKIRLWSLADGSFREWQTGAESLQNWDIIDGDGAWVKFFPTEEEQTEYFRRHPEMKFEEGV